MASESSISIPYCFAILYNQLLILNQVYKGLTKLGKPALNL